MSGQGSQPPLVCPSCASSHGRDERFCPDCGMPLVEQGPLGGEARLSEREERARKVKPQYAEGSLVRVAHARDQVEAEFIQALLLEEGVPSLVRRAAGFDVPDFLAVGPRDVMVAQSGEAVARDVLLQTPVSGTSHLRELSWRMRLLAGLMLAFVAVAFVLFMATHIAQ